LQSKHLAATSPHRGESSYSPSLWQNLKYIQGMTSGLSKSHQSFLRGHVLQTSISCDPHSWSFSARKSSAKRKVVVGFALSSTQKTRGRLVSARINPRTVKSPTCSKGRSHCGSGQKDPVLLYPLPRAAAAPLQTREQHPTAAAPIFTKLPAVGHGMEVTAVWHRRMSDMLQGGCHSL